MASLVLLLSGCLQGPDGSRETPEGNPFIDGGFTVALHVGHQGTVPSEAALAALEGVMAEVGTETIRGTTVRLPPEAQATHRLPQLADLVWAGSTIDRENKTLHLRIVYLDGQGEQLGYTQNWREAAIFLWPENMRTHYVWRQASTSVPTSNTTAAERTTLVHEYGHLLGLVDCGLQMQVPRADPASRCHSTEGASVMQANLTVSDNLLTWALDDEGGPIWRFSANDWADIRAAQRAAQESP